MGIIGYSTDGETEQLEDGGKLHYPSRMDDDAAIRKALGDAAARDRAQESAKRKWELQNPSYGGSFEQAMAKRDAQVRQANRPGPMIEVNEKPEPPTLPKDAFATNPQDRPGYGLPFKEALKNARSCPSLLPAIAEARKALPLYSGLIRYFPDALIAVAELSRIGNDQHNPGQPLHWARHKSTDELDAATRHLFEAGHVDSDGVRHSTKLAWRALANLQKEIEADGRK